MTDLKPSLHATIDTIKNEIGHALNTLHRKTNLMPTQISLETIETTTVGPPESTGILIHKGNLDAQPTGCGPALFSSSTAYNKKILINKVTIEHETISDEFDADLKYAEEYIQRAIQDLANQTGLLPIAVECTSIDLRSPIEMPTGINHILVTDIQILAKI